ncbi:hypothetical protein M011DRAFT_173996 [Sporormia fimetaria CBS 119925]|uniref:Uncharacterized protein n=1 Tax=Sporormia fimetaria CBS 119925 TaxID=1340428 RepID=A0A6A6VK98_9PLEO|nr:hypothetical protein M011DRAFT_173996 [Sporormia fimetaria CBS 119925]
MCTHRQHYIRQWNITYIYSDRHHEGFDIQGSLDLEQQIVHMLVETCPAAALSPLRFGDGTQGYSLLPMFPIMAVSSTLGAILIES